MRTMLALCASAALLASCQAPPPAAAPAADAAAITREITAIEVAWSAQAAAKDIAGFAARYDDDAWVYLSGAPPMHGPAAVQAGLGQVVTDPNFSIHFETVRVRVAPSGDMACSEGTYTQGATNPATHQPATEHGNYVTCWRKNASGEWRAFADISTADPTAGGPSTPAPAAANAAAP